LFFDSLNYMLFVPLLWLVYQFVPDGWRWAVLLTASVAFYLVLNAPLLLLALAVVILSTYFLGLRLAQVDDDRARVRYLWIGIAVNIAVLFLIKYLRRLVEWRIPDAHSDAFWSHLFVTLGVSYYTLQAISYLVDLYLGTAEPETHLGHLALYLAFFPKLLQGPIERAGDLLPQLRAPYRCSYDNVRSGLLLFAWGLFKKAAVANRLAIYVGSVYRDVHAFGGVSLLLATYMYAIQILADFSGYTDMALGVARMFNIRLTQNFNAPYMATSVADFWRRWHISFSRWILDYIFKPLQIQWRSAGTFGVAAALMITFLFSGLWHGAAWTFAIWGALHGTYLAASVFLKPWRDRVWASVGLEKHPLRRVIQVVVTFNLVAFAWIFFRANSTADAWYVATHVFAGMPAYVMAVIAHAPEITHLKYLWDPILMEKGLRSFVLVIIAVTLMLAGGVVQRRVRIRHQPLWLRWTMYYGLLLCLFYLSIYDDMGFVYFQF